jgi:nucleotide-binding universal stress UspA family protein
MKKIVVGYDESDQSRRALERAAQLTKAFDSQLTVMSVAPIVYSVGRSAGAIDPAESPAKHMAELADAKTYLEGQGINAEYQGAVGDVADTLVELAEDRGADLIIVGTREENLLLRVLGQSVSDTVQRKAHVDVLIVH